MRDGVAKPVSWDNVYKLLHRHQCLHEEKRI